MAPRTISASAPEPFTWGACSAFQTLAITAGTPEPPPPTICPWARPARKAAKSRPAWVWWFAPIGWTIWWPWGPAAQPISIPPAIWQPALVGELLVHVRRLVAVEHGHLLARADHDVLASDAERHRVVARLAGTADLIERALGGMGDGTQGRVDRTADGYPHQRRHGDL